MAQAIQQAVRLGILTFLAAAAPVRAYSDTPVPEPVDLGLSVKWADRNLGAASPLEAGGYYSFGEVTEKDYYDWSTYSHCDDGDMFAQHNIGEESICGTQYDAARAILGDDWRMPTAEEMEELISTCSMEYIEDEPMSYVRLTSPDWTFIDFPVTGYMSLGRVVRANQDLAVWTGSFYVEAGEEDGFVYYMNGPFYLAGVNPTDLPVVYEGTSSLGLQIRPVYCGGTSGVTTVVAGNAEYTAPELYTLDGRRLPGDHTVAPGFYIKEQGDRATKVVVK